MMRLIDADALDFSFPLTDDIVGMLKQIGIEMAKAVVDNAPTIEVECLVRCKDCRFCEKYPTSDMASICTNEQWKTEYYPLVKDNDFCSHGERRDEDAAD